MISHVPKLVDQPKWFLSDTDIKICDIVLFTKQEGALSRNYQYGMVNQTEDGKDGKIRRAQIKYRNSHENIDRYTWRSVRQLVLIHPIDELNIMEEISLAAKY